MDDADCKAAVQRHIEDLRRDDRKLLRSAAWACGLSLGAFLVAANVQQWSSIAVGLAAAVVLGIDCYLARVLYVAAQRADDKVYVEGSHDKTAPLFPTRATGLKFVALLTSAVTFAFAAAYVGDRGLGEKDWSAALYSSLVVLGLNDPVPANGYGRAVVSAHFITVILLVLGVFALLISRLSSFAEKSMPTASQDAMELGASATRNIQELCEVAQRFEEMLKDTEADRDREAVHVKQLEELLGQKGIEIP